MTGPGRNCPLAYRYRPGDLGTNPRSVDADVLYVIGGLYGNPLALAEIEAMADRERAAGHRVELVFNGDFNWFNIEPDSFQAFNQRILAHTVVLGNVEWELANESSGAGCGCGYPDTVDDAVVTRSNRIIEHLRTVARSFPDILERLRAQPRYQCLHMNGQRIVVLHGDPESMAGWGLALESLRDPAHQPQLRQWLEASGATVIAATHTCLPALWSTPRRAIVNNGSAGMGNLHNDPRGLIGRISLPGRNHPRALLTRELDALTVELIPVPFSARHWADQFGQWWPQGTDAALSYGDRICHGTHLHPHDVLLDQALGER